MALASVEEDHDEDDNEHDLMENNVIDWCVLTRSLYNIIGEGILCVMVLSSNGTLLSSYGTETKAAKRIIPPLLTSIWNITSKVGEKFVDARGLELMFVNCKKGRIGISVIPDEQPYFICLLAENQMELGLLKVKLELITDQLAKILFNEQDDEEEEDEEEEEDDEDNHDQIKSTLQSANGDSRNQNNVTTQ